MQRTTGAMGISKRCCYLCDFLLRHFCRVSYRGATGKVFAWALPPWDIPERIQRAIWVELKRLIREALADLGITATDRFLSDTEGGQSDSEVSENELAPNRNDFDLVAGKGDYISDSDDCLSDSDGDTKG